MSDFTTEHLDGTARTDFTSNPARHGAARFTPSNRAESKMYTKSDALHDILGFTCILGFGLAFTYEFIRYVAQ